MVKKSKFKSAYTLFEACLVMALVAIFVCLMASVIPHKPKDKARSDAHGHYECFYDESKNLKQITYSEGATPVITAVNSCTFTPPPYSRYLIFSAVGAGAEEDVVGAFATTFYNSSLASSYTITPGKDPGDDTVITAEETDILKASGGNIMQANRASVSDIESCTIKPVSTKWYTDQETGDEKNSTDAYLADFLCDKGPTCSIERGMIRVDYCHTAELYKSEWLPLNSVTGPKGYLKSQYIADTTTDNYEWNKYDSVNNILYYCDNSVFTLYNQEPVYERFHMNFDAVDPDKYCKNVGSKGAFEPSLFQLILKFKSNSSSADSEMVNYIKTLQFGQDCSDTNDLKKCDPITQVQPGNVNKSGAVLIIW